MIEQLEQTGPEAARFGVRGLLQDTRENPLQFTRIEIQSLTGWTEIEFSLFDDDGFEVAPFTARTLATARTEFQFVNGIEFLCESTCILIAVKQLVQGVTANPDTRAGRATVHGQIAVRCGIEAVVTLWTFHCGCRASGLFDVTSSTRMPGPARSPGRRLLSGSWVVETCGE